VPSPKQSRIFSSFPLLKFYRGFSVTIIGMIPYSGTSFLAWDYLRAKMYRIDAKPSRVGNLVIGAISGVLGQTVSYPFEVVRRRMQVGGLTQPDRWMSWRETVRTIWRQGGWQGFFVGLSIGYLKMVPMTAVSFAVWEEMKGILDVE
jgi:solute carrier family 25 (mitochondrial carrier protein), member 16